MSDNVWRDLSAAASDATLGVALAAVIVAIAALAITHVFSSSVLRRTVWQSAIVAMLALLGLQFSGLPQAAFAVFDSLVHTPADAPTFVLPDDVLAHENALDLAAGLSRDPADAPWIPLDANMIAGEAGFADVAAAKSERSDVRPADRSNAPSFDVASGSSAVEPIPPSPLPVAAIALVWIAGAAFMLVRQALASRGMASLARRLPAYVEPDGDARLDVRELAAVLRVRRAVRLVALPAGCSPIAFGILQPTIGLPADFARRFTAPQRRAVLAHELAHFAAGDPLWRSLADVLVALLWWHPAAWLTRRRLIDASEAVADEASRALPGGAEQLAAALVVLGKRLARRRALNSAYGADGEFRSSLGRRVERLLAECESPWSPVSNCKLTVTRAVCGTAAIVLVLSVCYGQHTHLSTTQGESEMRTFTATWRQSLCGIALAALASGPARGDAPAGEVSADAAPVAVLQEGEEKREEPRREREGERPREGERRADRPGGEREGGERAEARRREAQDIAARVERIRNRLRELGDNNPDESRELSEQVERLANRLRELRGEGERREGERPEREGEGRERSPEAARVEARRREAQEVFARVRELQARLAELGDRNPDESREIGQQLERLMRRMQELRGERERERGEGDRPDAGRPDADRPDRERPGGERRVGDRPDRDRPDRERGEGDESRRPLVDREIMKARHLRSAIDHLNAGGMHDAAERLARDNAELLSKLPDRGERRVPPGRPGLPGRPDRPGGPDRLDGPPREGDRPRPERPDGPPRDGDRPRPDRPDGPPRDGDRPRPDRPDRPGRPDRDRPDGDPDRRPDAERREDAARDAAELRRALSAQHEAGDMLRQKLEAVAKALAERTLQAQVEEASRQAALKQLEAARAAEQAKLAELAERRAAELALVQAELQAQMAKLKAEVEKLRDELAAKEAELTKTRELIEKQVK